jgi:hypothetical protein
MADDLGSEQMVALLRACPPDQARVDGTTPGCNHSETLIP